MISAAENEEREPALKQLAKRFPKRYLDFSEDVSEAQGIQDGA